MISERIRAELRERVPELAQAIIDHSVEVDRLAAEPPVVRAPKPRGWRPKISRAMRRAVLDRDDGRCQYCWVSFPPEHLQLDHVVPLAHGGLTTRDNLVAACGPCNQVKGDRLDFLPLVWPRRWSTATTPDSSTP